MGRGRGRIVESSYRIAKEIKRDCVYKCVCGTIVVSAVTSIRVVQGWIRNVGDDVPKPNARKRLY